MLTLRTWSLLNFEVGKWRIVMSCSIILPNMWTAYGSRWVNLTREPLRARYNTHAHAQHQRGVTRKINITKPVRRPAGTSTESTPVPKVRAAQYQFEYHGANGTHDTRECLVLNGNQGSSHRERTSQRRVAMVASAVLTTQSHWWEARRQPPAYHNRDLQPNKPQCSYCKNYGHCEDRCVTLHPG